MKIIINEQQYQQLFESDSKKLEFYQSFVNNTLKKITDKCEGDEHLSIIFINRVCDVASSINNIKVVSVTKSSMSSAMAAIMGATYPTTKNPLINVKTPIVINIIINYESIKYIDFDALGFLSKRRRPFLILFIKAIILIKIIIGNEICFNR